LIIRFSPFLWLHCRRRPPQASAEDRSGKLLGFL
jgi:hypothetical protein